MIRNRMDRNELGARIRDLRAKRGLSLTQLEAETEISSSFLSQVESGKSDISISRLMRIADFFQVDLGELVGGNRVERRTLEVMRDGDGDTLISRGEGVTTRFLGHSRWQLAPRISEFAPGGTVDVHGATRDLSGHPELYIYVVCGTFRFEVQGADPVTVSEGDSMLLRSDIDQAVNVGSDAGRLLAVGLPGEAATS
jgi:transcriptional regulator with XRE-family HTH domain